MSSECSSSGEESAVEWEEIETPLTCLEDSQAKADSNTNDIQISLEKSGKKKTNAAEQARRAHLRQIQENLHKIHLLCLLANGQSLINQCDNKLYQGIILSLTPANFVLSTPSDISDGDKSLMHLLRWFVANTSLYRQSTNQDSIHFLQELSDVQLLVTLCKSLGLRTRLVLTLQTLPLKPLYSSDSPSLNHATPSKKTSRRLSKVKDHLSSKENNSLNEYKHRPIRKCKKRQYNSDDDDDDDDDDDETITSPYFDNELKSLSSKKKKIKLEEEKDLLTNNSSSSFYYNTVTSWAEVMLTNKKWRSLHLPSVSVGQPVLCEKHVGNKLHYVIGFEHCNLFRDLTPRYSSQWCTGLNKERVDRNWWNDTLSCYNITPDRRELELEDNDIKEQLLSGPLPAVLSHYKNHPLYALKRHLLTYESIYPPDSPVLGQFKGESVYSRDCVQTLHTRESWLKEGLIIKQGEQPYKIVKARKRKGQDLQNNTSQLYGKWQTRLYIPDPVVNGCIPKNEYGNIELFTSSMLPEGAVYLRQSSITKIARKLGIDYAPAMRGWEFNKGACYPVIDGIVIAKEYEDILLEAWQQQEQITIEKDIQKHHSIVLERWIKLTKGLLINERVKQRYRDTYTQQDNDNYTNEK